MANRFFCKPCLEKGHQCYAIEGVNFASAEDAVCQFCDKGVPCPVTQREQREQRQCRNTSVPLDWRQCAEYYLNKLWYPYDRRFIRAFSTGVTCDVLHDLCVEYSVARTISGTIYGASGVEGKYRPFADMLNRYRDTTMTRQHVPQIMRRETDNMQSAYGKGFESAISKALWMMKQHPVVIYDANAWYGLEAVSLKPRDYSYRAYYDSWFRFFERWDTRVALDDAVKYLTTLPRTQELISKGTIDAGAIDSPWFRNRITDVRLWFLGGGKA